MQLAPLTPHQQQQIVENRIGSHAGKQLSPHIETLLDSEGNSICGNPLMLSMVISIFQAGGAVFPKTRFELYESAVSTMLTRLDFKDIAQRATSLHGAKEHVRGLLVALAADRQHAHDKDITDTDAEKVCEDDESWYKAGKPSKDCGTSQNPNFRCATLVITLINL